ncbi:MAG: hypothetical protein DMF32_01965 [Verrucomicrobia bacterium]|nr:MAG: hypothetical protein DMF32_01965 [Verrucomicrobiota bacterium]
MTQPQAVGVLEKLASKSVPVLAKLEKAKWPFLRTVTLCFRSGDKRVVCVKLSKPKKMFKWSSVMPQRKVSSTLKTFVISRNVLRLVGFPYGISAVDEELRKCDCK